MNLECTTVKNDGERPTSRLQKLQASAAGSNQRRTALHGLLRRLELHRRFESALRNVSGNRAA